MGVIAENLREIEEKIYLSCGRAGRDREAVRLMAVSKLQPEESIREALDLGLRLFGESRVQETMSRTSLFPEDAEVHLIGHLQRNKARDAASFYHAIQSIDAVRTVEALEMRLDQAGRTITAMVEVNTSGEESKQGVTTYEDLLEVARSVQEAKHMRLTGLMTIGPISTNEKILRTAFASLRDFRDRLERDLGAPLPELSMGMSNDLEEAILEGATMVRIGSSLFGERRR
ncbi:MAG: YggS family pyridoxal phosphate-dependent enzyme [Spirochaetaceae bacterium]|nr:MAG: YggS family pyridoxal phosphate-dependent enzyme [Spirochaetaceae bacterium]